MHERRNLMMIVLLLACAAWSGFAWIGLDPGHWSTLSQRVFATLMAASLAAWLFYAMKFEDKLPDHLRKVVGEFYYEADGLSFMPMVRLRQGRAELCVYYQNRYENPVEAIVHLRPPPAGESFEIRPGMRDVHFAFRAGGGDFGVIHQPIFVPPRLAGQVIEVRLAASSWYPRSHGARLRSKAGMACGSLLVDWGGNPLRIGVHEVCGEMPLQDPVTLRMSLPPVGLDEPPVRTDLWRQEMLAAGAAG